MFLLFEREESMPLNNQYKTKVKNLITELEKDLYEREECVRLVLLACFAGKAIFLYGPPGTAKSMIARKVSLAFASKDDKTTPFFSALMHRFSTPEDIFGPIDIGALKENKLIRNIEGYLPTAHFAFLDEILEKLARHLKHLTHHHQRKVV
ncbi:AAA family ATPase [Helicobacter gastrocanis]|nr:AAA family ATPase [Helicobacter sp. NHP19-003]